MAQYTGCCIYCGQTKLITAGEGLTDDEVNKLAILECNCDEAQAVQKVEQKKTYAEANIKRLFAEDGESFTEMLLSMVDGLAKQNIKKISAVSAMGIRAQLTAKENSIKVERTEVKKSALED